MRAAVAVPKTERAKSGNLFNSDPFQEMQAANEGSGIPPSFLFCWQAIEALVARLFGSSYVRGSSLRVTDQAQGDTSRLVRLSECCCDEASVRVTDGGMLLGGVPLNVGNTGFDRVRWDAEPDGLRRLRDRLIDRDDVAVEVKQRTTGVALIHRCRCLQQVLERVIDAVGVYDVLVTVQGRRNTDRDGLFERQRLTDRDDPVALLYRVGVAERQWRRKMSVIHLEQRDVVPRILTENARRHFGAVCEDCGDKRRAVNDVIGRENQPVAVVDESRAGLQRVRADVKSNDRRRVATHCLHDARLIVHTRSERRRRSRRRRIDGTARREVAGKSADDCGTSTVKTICHFILTLTTRRADARSIARGVPFRQVCGVGELMLLSAWTAG